MEVHAAPLKRYRHLFFDLDHTLWDFRTNSRAVLTELHAEFGLSAFGIPCEGFIDVYESVNAELWESHDRGGISKDTLRALRFRRALGRFAVKDNHLASLLDRTYMERCPLRTALIPGAMRLLEDLRPHYRLHIITNGFTGTQDLKLKMSGIRPFFDVVLTSEQAGANKPSVLIFRRALRLAAAHAGESLIIGDNATADIEGARNVGMDQVHFAPGGPADPAATYRIMQLDGLRPLLL